MKNQLVILLSVTILCFTGCGNKDVNDATMTTANEQKNIISEQNIQEISSDISLIEKQEPIELPPLSTEQKIVNYEGTIPLNYITATYDTIYLSGRDYGEGSYLLKMQIGESSAETMSITPPKGMEFTTITTDEKENLYVIVKNIKDANRCEIWKINKSGEVEAQLDISSYMEREDWAPWAIAVAENGDIYLRIGQLEGILAMVFDSEGHFLSKILDEGRKYDCLWAMGRGKDGKVYAILMDDSENFNAIIAEMDGRNGCVGTTYTDILEGGAFYDYVGSGRDSDLIIYGVAGGIYGYDLGSDSAKWNIPASEMPFELDSLNRMTSLKDGRFLFMQRGIDMKNDEIITVAEGTKFYYIPAAKQ